MMLYIFLRGLINKVKGNCMKNHYVYLLSSKIKEKYYIGVRTCKCKISDDKYMGSSSAMNESDKLNCNKIILARFSTRKEAIKYEIELHNKFNVAKNELFWNKSKQTSEGFDITGAKFKLSNEAKEKISNYRKGKKHSEETKQKMSKPKNILKPRKINNGMKGKHHSEETKKYLSELKKGQYNHNGSNNPNAKSVICIDTGEIFSTIKEANAKYKTKNVGLCCRGKVEYAAKMKWKFL